MGRDWTWKRLEGKDGPQNVAPNTLVVNRQGDVVRHQCPKRTIPALERFLNKIAVSNVFEFDGTPCWMWQGHINAETGYGQLKDDSNKTVNAHAFAHDQFVGDLENGQELTQGCDRRACCSPHHVYAVARSQNKKRSKKCRTGTEANL